MLAGSIWSEGHPSLQNFTALSWDQRQTSLMKNSLGLAVGTTILSLLIGLPLGFVTEKTDLPGRHIFRGLCVIPLLIPPYIHAIIWSDVFGRSGVVNRLLMTYWGWPSAPLNIYSLPGAIFVMSISYFPFVTLIFISGLRNISRDYEENGLLYGPAIRTITNITLPLTLPHILGGALFVFVLSLVNFGVPDMLRVRVYALEIFIEFSAFFRADVAIARSLPFLFMTILMVLWLQKILRNHAYIRWDGGNTVAVFYRLGRMRWMLSALVILILMLSSLTPIVVLMKMAGPLSIYRDVMRSSIEPIGYSIFMGLIGSASMMVLSVLIAHSLYRKHTWADRLFEMVLLIPIAFPAAIVGVGLIHIWNRPITEIIYSSSVIVIFAYIARFVAFTSIICLASFRQMDKTLEEAGVLNTNSQLVLLRDIILPMNRSMILAGLFIGFVLSIGDLSASLLVIPPGRSTIPVTIYNLMHYGAKNSMAALSLILIGILFLSAWIFGATLKYIAPKHSQSNNGKLIGNMAGQHDSMGMQSRS